MDMSRTVELGHAKIMTFCRDALVEFMLGVALVVAWFFLFFCLPMANGSRGQADWITDIRHEFGIDERRSSTCTAYRFHLFFTAYGYIVHKLYG